MKLNNRGMTMVEIIVSVVLISIVLIFLMNLFLHVRTTYNNSKIQSEYEILNSNIVKAVGDDISNYGLKSIKRFDTSNGEALLLTFNTTRETHLSENIKKVLKVYAKGSNFYISYAYESCPYNPSADELEMCMDTITTKEKITMVSREVPEDAVLDTTKLIHLGVADLTEDGSSVLAKIKIPISTSKGTVYDINIYGVIGS